MNQSQAIIEYVVTNTLNPVEVLYLLSKASNVVSRLSVYTLPDGAVGLFKCDDGHNYEVIVRPAVYAQFKSLFGSDFVAEDKTKPIPLDADRIKHMLAFLEDGAGGAAVGSLNSLGAVPMGGADSRRRRKTRKGYR